MSKAKVKNDALYIGNDNLVELLDLKDAESGVFINNATVQVTVYDSLGTQVAGVVWPVDMIYEDGSNGIYQGIIDKAMTLIANAFYRVTVTASAPGGLDAEWDIKVQAVLRTS